MMDLSGESVFALIQGAEQLKKYVLRIMKSFGGKYLDDNAAHKKAIIMSYLSLRLLQLSYLGTERLLNISEEAEEILMDLKCPDREA